MGAIPAAEVEITPDLVRALLIEQHPDLAALPIGAMTHGWDNVMVRLGNELVLRMPRREASAQLIEYEQRWLPVLAPQLPVPVHDPIRIGVPGCGYPWHWSVCRWYIGTTTGTMLDQGRMRAEVFAPSLARFQSALHTPAPNDAPENPWRGVPLANRNEATLQRIEQFAEWLDVAAAKELWAAALIQPRWNGPPLWLQGDPHPLNLLVNDDSELVAALDFGDITAGDPASDLSSVFMHLPPTHWPLFKQHYQLGTPDVDYHSLWMRAQGWALSLALAFMVGSEPGEQLHRCATRTLDSLGVSKQ